MAAIINQEQTLLRMFPGDQIGSVTNAVYRVVEKSFIDDKMNHPTRDEVKRRFEICIKWVKILRGDKHWSISRIEGRLPEALRTELQGGSWTPNERRVWLPESVQ
jgi:hypothetical protein